MAAMENFPTQVLSRVFLHLPPSDRLNCALVCRRWAEVISSSSLFKNIRLNIAGFEMSGAAPVLIKSSRQYSNLVLERANFTEYNEGFWKKMGENLLHLKLKCCTWTPRVFYSILRKCPKLETLKLEASPYPQNFELPEDISADEIRKSLGQLRNLYLRMVLSRENFSQLLELMPHLAAIHLSCNRMNSDLVEHLPNMLETNEVIAGIDFRFQCDVSLSDNARLGLLNFCATSLRELQFDESFSNRDAYALIGRCTQLRRFTLWKANSAFTGDHLKTILSNNPHLEILEVESCVSALEEGLANIFQLKNLHRLSLRCCRTITNDRLCDLGRISTLRRLDVIYLKVDSRVLRSLACLKDLEAFFMHSDCMDSECLTIICENFKKLKVLDLGWVARLTDQDAKKLSHLKELKTLEFFDASGFTAEAFRMGVGPSFIQSLVMDGSPATDIGLRGIAAHNGRLKELNITNFAYITDAGLTQLLHNEPLLEHLWIQDCTSLRGNWLSALIYSCPRLRVLSVYGCQIVVPVAVQFGRERPEVLVD